MTDSKSLQFKARPLLAKKAPFESNWPTSNRKRDGATIRFHQ